jgi:hypothetical protein
MDFRKLVRNPAKVRECLREMEDTSVVAIKPVRIYIPTRYAERNLASVGADTWIVGICATVTEDGFYSVSLINAMWRIEPTSTEKVMFDEDEYFEFYFEPGARFISTTNLVKTDTLVYRIYDEIVSKANVPWYLNYMDMGRIFDTAKYHAGTNVGENNVITELIISIIARDMLDRHIGFRLTLKEVDDVFKKKPAYIALRSVTYAASNTTNKLAGNRFQDGMVSALVTPTDRVEKLEELLRK